LQFAPIVAIKESYLY